jgi:hypothetical protein
VRIFGLSMPTQERHLRRTSEGAGLGPGKIPRPNALHSLQRRVTANAPGKRLEEHDEAPRCATSCGRRSGSPEGFRLHHEQGRASWAGPRKKSLGASEQRAEAGGRPIAGAGGTPRVGLEGAAMALSIPRYEKRSRRKALSLGEKRSRSRLRHARPRWSRRNLIADRPTRQEIWMPP